MLKKLLYPHSVKDIKGKVAVAELRRAHFIIALLSASFAYFLIMITIEPIYIDELLGAITVALLLIIAGSSLATAAALRKK